MNGYTVKRTAKYDWQCYNCKGVIFEGEEYRDYGYQEEGRWKHLRRHLICPLKTEYPDIIATREGEKEWVLGEVTDLQGNKVFLTKEWEEEGKYHFRKIVYDQAGDPRRPQ